MGIGLEPTKQTTWHKGIEIKLEYRTRKNSILSLPPCVWYYYVLQEEDWRTTKNDAIAAAKRYVNKNQAPIK